MIKDGPSIIDPSFGMSSLETSDPAGISGMGSDLSVSTLSPSIVITLQMCLSIRITLPFESPATLSKGKIFSPSKTGAVVVVSIVSFVLNPSLSRFML